MTTFVTESVVEMIPVCESKPEFGYTEVIRNREQKARITAGINEFWRHTKKQGLIV